MVTLRADIYIDAATVGYWPQLAVYCHSVGDMWGVRSRVCWPGNRKGDPGGTMASAWSALAIIGKTQSLCLRIYRDIVFTILTQSVSGGFLFVVKYTLTYMYTCRDGV